METLDFNDIDFDALQRDFEESKVSKENIRIILSDHAFDRLRQRTRYGDPQKIMGWICGVLKEYISKQELYDGKQFVDVKIDAGNPKYSWLAVGRMQKVEGNKWIFAVATLKNWEQSVDSKTTERRSKWVSAR